MANGYHYLSLGDLKRQTGVPVDVARQSMSTGQWVRHGHHRVRVSESPSDYELADTLPITCEFEYGYHRNDPPAAA